MDILVNGEPHQVAANSTVADLLDTLDVEPRHVAVEVNLELVSRRCHRECQLSAGDRLEIVTLVGGG